MTMRKLLLVLILFSSASVCAAQDKRRFKVGVVLPLTGGLAPIAESVRNGVILADREADAGDAVEFRFEDDAFNPRVTVTAVRRFLDLNKVDALITFGSSTALAASGVAESAKIPMICLSVDPKIVAGKKYVMKHWATAEAENQKVTEEVKRRQYKTVAIVATLQDAMLAHRDNFIKSAKAKAVINEDFPPTEMDFRSIASRIVLVNPDAVYILLLPPQTSVFAKQLRAAGYVGEFFSGHHVENRDEVGAAGGALDGTWFVTQGYAGDPEFDKRYRAAFGEEPYHGAPNGYDSAKLLIEALKTPSPNDYLHRVKTFHGVIGVYGATPKNDFELPVVLKRVAGNGFAPL